MGDWRERERGGGWTKRIARGLKARTAIDQLGAHEEEGLELLAGASGGLHGVVDHVDPEIRHRLMEGGSLMDITSSREAHERAQNGACQTDTSEVGGACSCYTTQ